MFTFKRKIHFIIILCVFSLTIVYKLQHLLDDEDSTIIIIWWTPFLMLERSRNCGINKCTFSSNRQLKHHSNFRGYLFYGSDFKVSDIPLPRGEETWSLYHEESPRNKLLFCHEPAISLFNFSSTVSRYSHVPLTLQYLTSLEDIIGLKHYKTTRVKNELRKKLASVIYIQSDCSTPNNRDSYVTELMKYIQIDSYGNCLHNKNISDNLKDAMKMFKSDEMHELISSYKFSISFENAVCHDYVTEKLWRPIIAGSIPIYYGSPSVKDWLPNNKSVILASDFESPKHLAEYLIHIDSNIEDYESHMEHKTKRLIKNNNLIKFFNPSIEGSSIQMIEIFECFVCSNTYKNVKSIIDKNHYNCLSPVSMVNGKPNESNWWHFDYEVSKCEANAFKKFVQNSKHSDGFTYFYGTDPKCDIK